MYCILKYVDYTDFKRTKNASESTLKSLAIEEDEPKNKILYFNPNCYIQLILDYICQEVGINTTCDYDICNESGELLGVQEYKPNIYGNVIFRPQEKYFVVLIKRSSVSNIFDDLMPLLHHHSDENMILIKNLKKSNSLTKKPSTSLKRQLSSRHSVAISQASSTSTSKSNSNNTRRKMSSHN